MHKLSTRLRLDYYLYVQCSVISIEKLNLQSTYKSYFHHESSQFQFINFFFVSIIKCGKVIHSMLYVCMRVAYKMKIFKTIKLYMEK